MRVRCAIIPSDMLHISTNCRTAEKMALTLLDYLFHREVQAVSNLSGQGKHGKKQLDPLTIYGIRCKCCLRPVGEGSAGGGHWGTPAVRGGLGRLWVRAGQQQGCPVSGRRVGPQGGQGAVQRALGQSWSGASAPYTFTKLIVSFFF